MSVYIIIVICGHIPENCLIIVVNGITAVTAIPELWIVRVHSVNHMGWTYNEIKRVFVDKRTVVRFDWRVEAELNSYFDVDSIAEFFLKRAQFIKICVNVKPEHFLAVLQRIIIIHMVCKAYLAHAACYCLGNMLARTDLAIRWKICMYMVIWYHMLLLIIC